MKNVLVIGAGEYQTVLIKRLIELGHKAYCVDKNENALGFKYATGYSVLDICNKEACLEYAKELCINAVMTYGATITLPTVAYIGKKLNLPALNEETAELSKNKYKIKEKLYNGGCNIYGNFFKLNSIKEKNNYTFEYPCIIKPTDGSGSKGVNLVNSENELNNAIEDSFKNARFNEVYYEKFIQGQEYSVEAFVCNNKIYIYGIIKSTIDIGLNNNISYGHRIPAGVPKNLENSIESEIVKAIKAMEITLGSVNFDLIVSDIDKKPYIIDCGFRIGQSLIASHLVPLSRGVSIIDNYINMCLQEKTYLEPLHEKSIATRWIICKPGKIVKIEKLDKLKTSFNIVDIILLKSVGEYQKVFKEKSDKIGYVICEGKTPQEAEDNAEKALKEIRKHIFIE